jgi:hypothetical protein
MPPGKAPSFDDFAQTTGMTVRGQCQVCALDPDLLEQVHRAYARGYRATAIRRYLTEACHVDVPVNPIHNHFARLHHEGAV